jgi:hypothetical protein
MCDLGTEQELTHDQFVLAMIISFSLIGSFLTFMFCFVFCAHCRLGDGGGGGGGGWGDGGGGGGGGWGGGDGGGGDGGGGCG